jgi:hypothetical protein
VQVLEAGSVAADDDHVHAALVLELELAHRLVALADREHELRRLRGDLQREVAFRDREAADRVDSGLVAVFTHTPFGYGGALAVRSDHVTGGDGHAEHQHQQRGEAGQLQRGAHAGSAS